MNNQPVITANMIETVAVEQHPTFFSLIYSVYVIVLIASIIASIFALFFLRSKRQKKLKSKIHSFSIALIIVYIGYYFLNGIFV